MNIGVMRLLPLQKQIVFVGTEWLPWLQTSWRDGGYERFLWYSRLTAYKTTWESAAQFTYNHSTLTTLTSVRESTGCIKSKFFTMITTLKCICNDSTDVLKIVSVHVPGLKDVVGSCLSGYIFHTTVSPVCMYAMKVPTLTVVKTANFYFGRDIASSSRGWGQGWQSYSYSYKQNAVSAWGAHILI